MTVKKLLAIPEDIWAEIEDFRFGFRCKTETEAMVLLLEAGLLSLWPESKKALKAKRSNPPPTGSKAKAK